MSPWESLIGGVILVPIAWCLGRIHGVLVAVHKELVRIRLATESLHDRVVPEVMVKGWMRTHGR